MKMGIERVLKEHFPFLKSVESVQPLSEENSAASLTFLTFETIDAALAPVKAAISSMGGQFEVRTIDNAVGKVVIGFKGPPRLKQGITLILKDVKGVQSTEFEDL